MKVQNFAKNFRLSMTGFALAFAVVASMGNAGIAEAATPALPASNHVNSTTVEMKSGVDTTGNLRLNVKSGSTKVDAPMEIYGSNHTKAQQFELIDSKLSSGGKYFYYIKATGSNLYLSTLGKKDNGTPVVQTKFTGSNAQQWSMHRVANGTYYFINRDSGKALDVKNGTKASANPVIQYTYNGSAAQKWSMYIVPTVKTATVTTASNSATVTTTVTATTTTKAYQSDTQIDVTNAVTKNGVTSTTKGSYSTTTTKINPAASTQTASTPKRTAANAKAMTSEEKALAKKIFNEYNKYRKSKGLKKVKWDESCAKMAFKSATSCAQRNTLTHRLGIAKKNQEKYSDILQYSTWKKSASSTVKAWKGSTGHRKMMQCKSATKAGVACFNNNGTWYYVIVYNFSGTNQSGK